MKSIDTLVSDIQELFGGVTLSDALEGFSKKLGETFLQRFSDYASERKPALRMSNIGRPLRQLWYEMRGFKGEELSPETKLKFLYGDIIEDLILFLAVEAGHEVTRLQEEIEVDGIKGHIDCFIDGVLVDVKSCSTRSFDKFKTGSLFDDDPFGYIAQLSGYAAATRADRAGFLAIGKEMGKVTFLEIPIGEYDVPGRIRLVKAAIESDEAPERCYEDIPDGKSGNRRLSVGCSYCAHKFRCWADANEGKGLQTFYYSTGPRYLTHVAKEPRVEKFDPTYNFPTKKED